MITQSTNSVYIIMKKIKKPYDATIFENIAKDSNAFILDTRSAQEFGKYLFQIV